MDMNHLDITQKTALMEKKFFGKTRCPQRAKGKIGNDAVA